MLMVNFFVSGETHDLQLPTRIIYKHTPLAQASKRTRTGIRNEGDVQMKGRKRRMRRRVELPLRRSLIGV